MKECPVCKRQFDDSLNFCTYDGHQLIAVNHVTPPSSPLSQGETDVNSSKGNETKQNGGCLKKILITVIGVVIVLVGLYNYLINSATYLRTEPAAVQVVKGGGSGKVDIDYDGYIWTVNHKPDWIDIEENDNDFKMSVSSNQTGQVREGTVTIQSGKLLAQVIVRQNAYATAIKASTTSVKFGKAGGTKDITIETDGCNWEAEYTNWMTVTKESETELHIKCPSNSDDFRTGTITVKEDNARVIISVRQAGTCNNCHGGGEFTCNACMGTGSTGYGMFYTNCMWCGGRGKTTCSVCGGSGERE